MRWTWHRWTDLDRDALYEVMRLRQDVFVVEQRCAYADADGRDPDAAHLLGTNGLGLAAYLRAFPPDEDGAAWIGRVVTASRVRGTGLGRPLMAEGLRGVRERFGVGLVRISAQAHLAAFYGSLGFVAEGEGYDEDGIPHLGMVLR